MKQIAQNPVVGVCGDWFTAHGEGVNLGYFGKAENASNGYPNLMETKKNKGNARKIDFYVLLFFLLAFAGWLWEAGIYLVTEQSLVNRGVYYGPYLPIYGVGGLLLWFLLQKFYQRPVVTFLLSAAICSVLEYGASVLLEWKWGMRWWDYSEYFLNLNGRICLLGAVCFGLGGMLLNCYLLPYYMRMYHRIRPGWRMILCGILLAVFILDITYCAVKPHTGQGIAW